jgi:hypothetical protein
VPTLVILIKITEQSELFAGQIRAVFKYFSQFKVLEFTEKGP